jgi:glycosyltransferase involved in cell wall biosynthesis
MTVLTYYNGKDARKGSNDVVRAIAKVKSEFPEAEFWAFGPEKDKYLQEFVKFRERPSDRELRRLYSNADIFFYASSYEGFGLPPMEAMACGCAVVSTDVGAVREFSIPGETALLSPPEDHAALSENIQKLLRDTDLQRKIAEKGYKHVQQFTWEHSTDLLEEAIG